jgi:hypothetical protein
MHTTTKSGSNLGNRPLQRKSENMSSLSRYYLLQLHFSQKDFAFNRIPLVIHVKWPVDKTTFSPYVVRPWNCCWYKWEWQERLLTTDHRGLGPSRHSTNSDPTKISTRFSTFIIRRRSNHWTGSFSFINQSINQLINHGIFIRCR